MSEFPSAAIFDAAILCLALIAVHSVLGMEKGLILQANLAAKQFIWGINPRQLSPLTISHMGKSHLQVVEKMCELHCHTFTQAPKQSGCVVIQ